MGLQVIEQVVNAARRKLLVQDYIPVYYPNLYITMEHSGRALETTKKYLEHLAVFEEFLAFSSIDLISNLEQRPHSRYLTDSELSRFVSDAGFSKETLAMKYAGMRLHPTKMLKRPVPKSPSTCRKVDPAYASFTRVTPACEMAT